MRTLKSLKEGLDFVERAANSARENAKAQDALAMNLRKEIVLLEAELAGPREWALAIDAFGKIAGIAEASIGGVVPIASGVTFPINTITVIEKKPVAVTAAMAADFASAWARNGNHQPTTAERQSAATVAALKAIGIDAIAAD